MAGSMAWQQAAPADISTRGSSIACTNQKRWAKCRAGSLAGAACCHDLRPYTRPGEKRKVVEPQAKAAPLQGVGSNNALRHGLASEAALNGWLPL